MSLIKKNIPNIITSSRIVFSVVFIFVIYATFCSGIVNAYLIVCFGAIILSDVMDGHIARKMNLVSLFGAKLDLVADLIYVVGVVGTLVYFHKLPPWFLFVLAVSFIGFQITSRLFLRYNCSQSHVIFDKLGKTAAILSMLIPGIYVFRCMIVDYEPIMLALAFIITSLFCASSVYRIMLVFKAKRGL